MIKYLCVHIGPLAQLAEHRTFNPGVVGSIPTRPTMLDSNPLRLQLPVTLTPSLLGGGVTHGNRAWPRRVALGVLGRHSGPLPRAGRRQRGQLHTGSRQILGHAVRRLVPNRLLFEQEGGWKTRFISPRQKAII